jgi:hypothetical protein
MHHLCCLTAYTPSTLLPSPATIVDLPTAARTAWLPRPTLFYLLDDPMHHLRKWQKRDRSQPISFIYVNVNYRD